MVTKLDQLIAATEEESRTQRITDEAYVRSRRALDEQIPGLWGRFRAAAKEQCNSRTKHLQFLVAPSAEIVVERRGSRRTMKMRLFRDSGVIEFACGEASGHFTFGLNEHNLAVICDQDGKVYASVEVAADEALSFLFV